ncbi:MAG: NADAR family protein [Bacteroidota bacterium]
MTPFTSFTKVKLPYGWMGNMSPFPVLYQGKTWKTNEHLFQALRFADDEIREAIRLEPSPMGCKMKVKTIVKELTAANAMHKRTVEPLSAADVENMEMCVRLKIQQHPVLVEGLLRTRDLPIYEDVTSRGKRGSNLFWGALQLPDGSWEGQNKLGELWMKIRRKIRETMLNPAPIPQNDNDADPYRQLREKLEQGEDIWEFLPESGVWIIHDIEPPDFSKPATLYMTDADYRLRSRTNANAKKYPDYPELWFR